MKISLNWLKAYIKTDLNAEQISRTLTQIGLEVEGFEKAESIRGGLAGLVVGEVLSWSPDEGGRVTLMSRNKIEPGQEIEFLLPGDAPLVYTVPENGLRDADGNWVQAINNPAHVFSMPCPHEVPVNAAIRSRTKHPTLKAA